jgi:Txe/YoeB family toxin of Txe-Axe toxin-antitoxin module
MRYGLLYDDDYSEIFLLKKKSPQFSSLAKTIQKKCDLIRQAPYGACKSERLRYNLTGKRSGRINDQYRLIYMVCEECIKTGDQINNSCKGCQNKPLKIVRFIDITDYH